MSEVKEQLLERLVKLIPINELQPNFQEQLLDRSEVLDFKKGRFIFKQGDKDRYSYYLLDGDIELHANKQLENIIQSNTDRANYALAQLQPRQFSAKTKTPVKVLQIDREVFDQILLLAQEATITPLAAAKESVSMEIDEVDGGVGSSDGDWMTQMLQSELFSRMPMANIHQLFSLLETINKKSGEVVIQQGESGEHYYIIAEGHCTVSRKPSPNSNDIELAQLGCGDSFGEEALISNATRNSTVTMTTDGVLMQMAKDDFVELIKEPTLNALSFADTKALVKEGAQWIDVRFPNEHKESSIKGSINIPLSSIRLQVEKLDRNKQYILFCDTGNRSSTAAFLLAEYGFDVPFLKGGLVNNSEAVSVKTATPKKPERQAKPPEPEVGKEVDAEVRMEMINAELETTIINLGVVGQEKSLDQSAEKKKEFEGSLTKQLIEKKDRLQKEKMRAQSEIKKKDEGQALELERLKQEHKKQMDKERKQLETIYDNNAQEMAKLKKAKKQAEESIRQERERLEAQAEVARKKLKEAEQLKQDIEASKKMLEKQAKKKRDEDETYVQQLQVTAKAEIEKKRKDLVKQYDRNNQEFEVLRKEKMAIEAARVAAKEEAKRIIREYKMLHDKKYAKKEEKLKAESLKLKEKAQAIQETMEDIQQAKSSAATIAEDDMAATTTQIRMPDEHLKRIKEKAAEAKKKAGSSLLSGISKRFGKK